jgi:histidine triad (HIT) family protein
MTMGDSCIFCDIVAGRAPAHRIIENEQSMVILDVNPYAEGHCLAIPKRHVAWWHEMTPEENASLFGLAHQAADRIMKAFKPDFVCLYARGRRIPHTHIFLIPTHGGDVLDRFFNALENFQESPRELARIAETARIEDAAERLRRA